jgi:hypothetical protein
MTPGPDRPWMTPAPLQALRPWWLETRMVIGFVLLAALIGFVAGFAMGGL